MFFALFRFFLMSSQATPTRGPTRHNRVKAGSSSSLPPPLTATQAETDKQQHHNTDNSARAQEQTNNTASHTQAIPIPIIKPPSHSHSTSQSYSPSSTVPNHPVAKQFRELIAAIKKEAKDRQPNNHHKTGSQDSKEGDSEEEDEDDEEDDNRADVQTVLTKLRKEILLHGLPIEDSKTDTSNSLRGDIWLFFLRVRPIPSARYMSLVEKGRAQPSESVVEKQQSVDIYAKIRGDIFRTFQKEEKFASVVQQKQMSRVLNAFTHYFTKEDGTKTFTYLQGMNALCGVFLYCMSELCAFSALVHFVGELTPTYWLESHIGAQAGVVLMDQILKIADPILAEHISKKIPNDNATETGAYIWGFGYFNSFLSSVRPFEELLHFWDFLFSFGVSLLPLHVAAFIIAEREHILTLDYPMQALNYRQVHALNSKKIIAISMNIIGLLPKDLLEKMKLHMSDMEVARQLANRNKDQKPPPQS